MSRDRMSNSLRVMAHFRENPCQPSSTTNLGIHCTRKANRWTHTERSYSAQTIRRYTSPKVRLIKAHPLRKDFLTVSGLAGPAACRRGPASRELPPPASRGRVHLCSAKELTSP